MTSPKQFRIYRAEGEAPSEDDVLEFRLTYDGPLLSTRVWIEASACENCGHKPLPPADTKADHKHTIRRHFHSQMKRLWDVHPTLKRWVAQSENGLKIVGKKPPTKDAVADKFKSLPFRWLPLVTEDSRLMCSLDVLYLRGDWKGSVLNNADIDNRMKTVIDALKIPGHGQMPSGAIPNADEDPFYVLLQDDSLVTRLAVETDILLSPNAAFGDNDSKVTVSVKLWRHSALASTSPSIGMG